MTLISFFEKYESDPLDDGQTETRSRKKRSDRILNCVYFCPNESCVSTFESEQELNLHLSLDQHTSQKSSLRLDDQAKILLFEKVRNENVSAALPRTSLTSTATELPRHYRFFTKEGWAIRTRKPWKAIDIDVKAFVKLIFDEERRTGMKLQTDLISRPYTDLFFTVFRKKNTC